MSTAQRVLDLARESIGYQEGPNNWNVFATRVDGGKWQNQPWCGVMVRDIFQRSGGLESEPSPVYTPAGAAAYYRSGRWLPRNSPDVFPGCVVFFDWSGSQNVAATDHVGLVESVEPGGVVCIEGNTQPPGGSGDQGNGGGCYRRLRPRNVIVGFGVPNYTQAAPQPAPSLEEDEMSTLVQAPNGSIWLCSGVFRRLVSIADAAGLEFLGTKRVKADAAFWGLCERTLKEV